jgi:hypothetical protein
MHIFSYGFIIHILKFLSIIHYTIFIQLVAKTFGIILHKFHGGIAHNVSAVYDVLAARIRALRSKDQGRQNVAKVLRGNEQCE